MENLRKLNDARVAQFIAWSQDTARYVLWQDGTTAPSIVEINYVGWQLLKTTIRGDEGHRYDHDFDAAAAEHYMYIRFLAGRTGDPSCHTAPALYAVKKLFDQVFGRLQSGQAHVGHPVLPANPYIVTWGQSGVVDGLKDYKSVSHGAEYKLGSAIESLAEFSLPKKMAEKIGSYAVKAGNTLPSSYKK
jgi:hypothetical protein